MYRLRPTVWAKEVPSGWARGRLGVTNNTVRYLLDTSRFICAKGSTIVVVQVRVERATTLRHEARFLSLIENKTLKPGQE